MIVLAALIGDFRNEVFNGEVWSQSFREGIADLLLERCSGDMEKAKAWIRFDEPPESGGSISEFLSDAIKLQLQRFSSTYSEYPLESVLPTASYKLDCFH